MHILEQKIRDAKAEGRMALIPFLTAGFPTQSRFWEHLEALDANGAHVLEIGVPFSDPVADGPVVAEASVRALNNGVTLGWILQSLAERRLQGRGFRAGLVLMGYYNPFLRYGLSALVQDMQAAGVHGCIVPDLPLEEAGAFRALLQQAGIALIALVAANTPLERMREYAAVSQGYVYVVSVLGVTGARQGLPPEVAETVRKVRAAFALPVALGFGLQHPAQLEALPPQARPDAAIFGSALLRHLDSGDSAEAFMQQWHSPHGHGVLA